MKYRVSVYSREELPSVSQILSVFSWTVCRESSEGKAIAGFLASVDRSREWVWLLVRRGNSNSVNAYRYSNMVAIHG